MQLSNESTPIADRVRAVGLGNPAEQQRSSGCVSHTGHFAPQRLAAPEVVALTASRDTSPTAGDDFGFFLALPLAIGGGLLLWGCIAAAWIAFV